MSGISRLKPGAGRHTLRLFLAVIWCLIGCGSDNTGPDPADRLRIVAGNNLSDTISSTPVQALVVRLLDDTGDPEVGVEVRFEAPTASRMLIGSVGSAAFGSVASATTDGDGRAAVRIQFSTRAGDGWVAISVPLFGLLDTARYTVRPGAPVRVVLTPRDTALSPGGTFTYRGSTVDRANNPRTDPATYEVVGTAVSVSSSGRVTAQNIGAARVRLRATIGAITVTDSGTVAVVPSAVVLWNNGSALMLGNLNGSTARIVTSDGLAASPEPQGSRIAFTRSGLFVIDTAGTTAGIPTPGFGSSTWPEWSRDRQWIYFHGDAGGCCTTIGRVRLDGTSLETLTTEPAIYASPAPDGSSLAYMNGGNLRVLNLQTRVLRTVPNATGVGFLRWSPDGQWIAYTRSDRVWIIRPDGTGNRQLNDRSVGTGINWSPDSRWILAPGQLIDAASGVTVSIPWLGQYPAWWR